MNWQDRAKQLAKDRGLKYKELAVAFGVTEGAVGHYLTGRREPTIEQFSIIASKLGVTLDYLFHGEDKFQTDYLEMFSSLEESKKRDIYAAVRVLSIAEKEESDL